MPAFSNLSVSALAAAQSSYALDVVTGASYARDALDVLANGAAAVSDEEALLIELDSEVREGRRRGTSRRSKSS